MLPFFIFDTNILSDLKAKDDVRITFIYQELEKMQQEIIFKGSSLIVKYATPEEAWKELLKEFNVKKTYTNHDYEPYAMDRDDEIGKLLERENISYHTYKDHVMFEKNDVLTSSDDPYKVYTPY